MQSSYFLLLTSWIYIRRATVRNRGTSYLLPVIPAVRVFIPKLNAFNPPFSCIFTNGLLYKAAANIFVYKTLNYHD
jgi:hypothetical protein